MAIKWWGCTYCGKFIQKSEDMPHVSGKCWIHERDSRFPGDEHCMSFLADVGDDVYTCTYCGATINIIGGTMIYHETCEPRFLEALEKDGDGASTYFSHHNWERRGKTEESIARDKAAAEKREAEQKAEEEKARAEAEARAAAQAQARAERKAANRAAREAEYAKIDEKNKSAEELARIEAKRLEGENKEALKKYDDDAAAERKAILAAERKDAIVIDGVVYNASKTKLLGRADKMEEGDKKAPSGSIVIPDGVTEIVTRAFYGCTTITSITIPASVKTIGQEAFKKCIALKSVTLSEGLEKIDTAAFEGCSALQTATIPSTVRELNGWRVPYTEVTYKEVYEQLADSGHVIYSSTSDRSIDLRYDAHGIFTNCTSLESVIIKARVKDLPSGMFLRCANLKAVSLPDTLKSVAYGWLTSSPVTTVYFPASVDKELLLSAFKFSSLIDVNIVGGFLSGSARKAFQKQQKLRDEVTLHENVPQKKADKAEFNHEYTKQTASELRAERAKDYEKAGKLSDLLHKLVFLSAPLWFAALHIANGASITIPGLVFLAVVLILTKLLETKPVREMLGDTNFILFDEQLPPQILMTVLWIVALLVMHIAGVWHGDKLITAGCVFVPMLAISILIKVLKCRNKAIKLGSLILGIAAVALPVLIGVVFTLFSPSSGSGSSGKPMSASKAAKGMAKWYTPEADIVVGQTYVPAQPSVNTQTGQLEPVEATEVFGKDGLAFGNYAYTVDTATHTITLITKNGFLGLGKKTQLLPYFADGSVVFRSTYPNQKDTYQLHNTFSSNLAYNVHIKQGAAFNAESAREVAGKTFSGKWSDAYDASVSFGTDGTATVKFSDGDVAKGAYLADAELNAVLYNHKNAGVWYAFTYSDDSDDVKFTRFYVKKFGNGEAWKTLKADSHSDWKKK